MDDNLALYILSKLYYETSILVMVLGNLFIWLVGCLASGALSRELKSAKPMPAISNSLVNFGKMDISFYLNDKFKDVLAKRGSLVNPSSSSFPSSIHDSKIEEPCPCSSLRNLKDPFTSHPSETLNKILMSNDLFSFNKELISSTLCCDSHEDVHEEGVFFEFSPTQNQMLANPMQANQLLMPSLTKILENVFPRRPPTFPAESIKSPAIDILLFPKRKPITDGNTDFFLKKKADIHPVGDNEKKREIEFVNLTPAKTNNISVKKDLGTNKPKEEKPTDMDNSIVKTSTNKS
ncbi:unnamed protein product, partial [Iphiclides podalirius]